MCNIKIDGAKKFAKPPRLRSLIKADKTLERNIKQSHYVAVMWENCVIGNPSQLNPCWYGWERNEGEKSLRPTLLPTETKMAPGKILQTARCKCISTQCKNNNNDNNKCSCVIAGLNCSKFCDCQQCDDQSDMHMDNNEIEDENNDSQSGTEDE